MSEDRSGGAVAGFLVGALVVGAWLGFVVRGKNAEIDALEERVAEAKLDAADARDAVEDERRRFDRFRDEVADLAQSDMVENVTAATVIGGAAASGCAPGYTNPLCDNWYDPYPGAWAWRQLRRFALAREVRHYGGDLVRRAAEALT